jgi:5-oxoprolinase (ATP-hydrolysing)
MRFLEPMTAAILSNHRIIPPFGLEGGESGALGLARVERADGSTRALGPTEKVEMRRDDVMVIETPGGGGFGKADAGRRRSDTPGTTT